MFKKLLFVFLASQLIMFAQTFQWVKTYPTNIVTNPTYLSSFTDVDMNGNPASSHLIYSREIYGIAYYGDHVIVKRNPSGLILFADTLFGKANMTQLCFDDSGNLYGAGTFRDTIYFNQSLSLTTTMINDEGFVFKMNPSGVVLWLKKASQLDQNIYYEPRLFLDNSGNFWISSSDNQLNSTLKKFNPDGTLLMTITQSNVRYIFSSDVDGAGNIWVTGSTFNGPVSFNGYNSTAPFIYNEYIVKYSPSGVCQWVNYVEDITFQEFRIECDNSGGAYLSGNLFDSTWFGNIKAFGPRWIYDFFVTKMDAAGNFIWLREVPFENTLGDASIGNGNFLSYSSGDEVYLTGFIRNTVNFGNGIIVQSIGSYDILVLKYNQSGDLLWAKNAGSISDETGCSIVDGNDGNLYLTGKIHQQSQFDTITVNASGLTTFIANINDAAVPVELISFTASLSGDAVELTWSTASEKNNKGFEIERMRESARTNWEVIGFVEGKGTTTELSLYSFKAASNMTGNELYRLKQLDYDGGYEYSNTIEIDVVNPDGFKLYQNFPNPFNPSTIIRFRVPENAGIVTLKVYDALGNEVAVLLNEIKAAGIYNVEFNIHEDLSSGIYYYKLNGSNFSEMKKMLILK